MAQTYPSNLARVGPYASGMGRISCRRCTLGAIFLLGQVQSMLFGLTFFSNLKIRYPLAYSITNVAFSLWLLLVIRGRHLRKDWPTLVQRLEICSDVQAIQYRHGVDTLCDLGIVAHMTSHLTGAPFLHFSSALFMGLSRFSLY